MYLDCEPADGYRRDQSVFGDCISIEDDMGVLVRYNSGAVMTYHLTAYSPWEGYRIAFNGTKGRLEYDVHENSYVSGSEDDANRQTFAMPRTSTLMSQHALSFVRIGANQLKWKLKWPKEVTAEVTFVCYVMFFAPGTEADPLGRAADHVDGAQSILTGIAANQSFATGLPVTVKQLLDL